jgi:hypothetical protein
MSSCASGIHSGGSSGRNAFLLHLKEHLAQFFDFPKK